MENKISVKSPITGLANITLLEQIKTDQLIRDWYHVFQIDIADELAGHDCIDLYQCNQTKLKFYWPHNVAGSDRLYEKLQEFDWFYAKSKWEYQVSLRDIVHCQQVLEVGSGFGYFIERALKLGLTIQGLELNASAAKIAQSNDLPVKNQDLSEFSSLYPSSQDAVCSFQVLEHIPQPKEFIKNCILALKPGGKLIFCVPNSDSFLKEQYNLLDMPPHHMTRWCRETFEALENIFPIVLESVKFEPLAPYHVTSFLDVYASKYRNRSKVYKLFFNRFSIPFYNRILKLGARHFFKGQSLYVKFRKL
jgi:2-polyprenyl-3-methyl-5-hydroxy-6-metoxy-1,4-benzoquinol methylase